MDTLLLIVSLVCFLLDAFNVPGGVKWFSLGVAAFVATYLV
jgi:hypothetical protein